MRQLLPALLLLIVTACQPTVNESICQAWKFNGFEISDELQEALNTSANEGTRKAFRDFLKDDSQETNWHFYPDGDVAVLFKGQYSLKRWKIDEGKQMLSLQSGDTLEYYTITREGENLKLVETNSNNILNGHVSATLMPNKEYEDGSIDLLAPTRNTWRVKPANPETFVKIKKRLTDQLTYMVDYFEMTNKKKQGYFNTGHLNAPFRFYSGGIGLLNQDQLPQAWWNQFNNKGDALEAYTLLELAFRSGLIFPNSEKTYTDAYGRFLKQVTAFVLAQEEPTTLSIQ